jgi:hypothetical protein
MLLSPEIESPWIEPDINVVLFVISKDDVLEIGASLQAAEVRGSDLNSSFVSTMRLSSIAY